MTREEAKNELIRLRDFLKNTRIDGEINLESIDIAIGALNEGEESDNIHSFEEGEK